LYGKTQVGEGGRGGMFCPPLPESRGLLTYLGEKEIVSSLKSSSSLNNKKGKKRRENIYILRKKGREKRHLDIFQAILSRYGKERRRTAPTSFSIQGGETGGLIPRRRKENDRSKSHYHGVIIVERKKILPLTQPAHEPSTA